MMAVYSRPGGRHRRCESPGLPSHGAQARTPGLPRRDSRAEFADSDAEQGRWIYPSPPKSQLCGIDTAG